MDVDELQRSRKKHKNNGKSNGSGGDTAGVKNRSTIGGGRQNRSEPSQESDLDDDDEDAVSTPSAENAERNVSSMLSAIR